MDSIYVNAEAHSSQTRVASPSSLCVGFQLYVGAVGSTQALDSRTVTEWPKSYLEAYLRLRLTTHGMRTHLLVLLIKRTIFPFTMLCEPHGPREGGSKNKDHYFHVTG